MKDLYLNLFMQNLYHAVEERLDDSEFTVLDLSRAVYLSHTQMYRKTKACTGKTPSQFIRSIRLKKAVQLLAQSKLKISEVAYEVGFTDPGYFTKMFKKEYGILPGEMRKEKRLFIN